MLSRKIKSKLKLHMKSQIAGIILSLLAASAFAADTTAPAIIPLPQKMELREGVFKLRPEAEILVDDTSMATGRFLADQLNKSTGYRLKSRVQTKARGQAVKGSIVLTTQGANADLGTEGYELSIKQD